MDVRGIPVPDEVGQDRDGARRLVRRRRLAPWPPLDDPPTRSPSPGERNLELSWLGSARLVTVCRRSPSRPDQVWRLRFLTW